MKPPPAPASLSRAGKALWRGVVREFELGPSDLLVLRQAADVADHCDELQEITAKAGPMTRGFHGQDQVHPAYAELRSERRLLLALLGGLGLTASAVEAPAGPSTVREHK